MTQTGKSLAVGTLICICCVGFLALIAYQSSEALSASRVQSLLQSFHRVLARDVAEQSADENDLRRTLTEHPISSSGDVLAFIVEEGRQIVAGNWDDQPGNTPAVVSRILRSDHEAPEYGDTFMQGDILVSWYRDEIPATPYTLVLASLESDRAWAEAIRVFIVPISIALIVGAWGLFWLALIFRRIFASEVAARQSAEDARLQAEQANLAKSDFLSMMSHELRTPLNGIIGFAQVLLFDKGTTLKGDHVDSAEQILKAGEQLLSLINQILDLSAIEAGGSPLKLEDVHAVELVDECVAMLAKVAESTNLRIDKASDIAGKLPVVRADRTRLKQVLLNLLGNAIKYNTTGRRVAVHWQIISKNCLRVSVIDDGPGIPAEHQDKVFVPFNRLGMAGKEIEGTGIGLSISKKIIELMAGRIGFESNPGEGTTFWFEIELLRLDPLPPQVPVAEWLASGSIDDDGQGAEKKLILYVEDNPANSLLMKRIVTRLDGCELVTTTTAEAGIEIAQSLGPELILMDINLPGMGGLEALEKLQKNYQTKVIPVIAVTAVAMDVDIQKGMDAGFSGYLTKPLNVADTLKVLSRMLTATPPS